MQVPVVKIVNVVTMLDRSVTTTGAVEMRMVVVGRHRDFLVVS